MSLRVEGVGSTSKPSSEATLSSASASMCSISTVSTSTPSANSLQPSQQINLTAATPPQKQGPTMCLLQGPSSLNRRASVTKDCTGIRCSLAGQISQSKSLRVVQDRNAGSVASEIGRRGGYLIFTGSLKLPSVCLATTAAGQSGVGSSTSTSIPILACMQPQLTNIHTRVI